MDLLAELFVSPRRVVYIACYLTWVFKMSVTYFLSSDSTSFFGTAKNKIVITLFLFEIFETYILLALSKISTRSIDRLGVGKSS